VQHPPFLSTTTPRPPHDVTTTPHPSSIDTDIKIKVKDLTLLAPYAFTLMQRLALSGHEEKEEQ
jgi:hypothetical protein